MPRRRKSVPSYRKHKASGQAIVTIAGRDHYLGPYGTRVSRDLYDKLVGEYLASGRTTTAAEDADIAVSELLAGFLDHADSYYRERDGETSKELEHFKTVMGVIRRLYGKTPAADFGPLALKSCRQELIDRGHGRRYVNANTGRMKRIFAWGVENELVPASVIHGLRAVSGLRKGHTEAPEGEPVTPVAEAMIHTTLPHMTATLAAMVRLQAATGMRPGELVIMRTADIDVGGKVWVYAPEHHKTEYRGHRRQVFIGPEGQRILKPYLRDDLTGYLFSPQDSEQERRAKQHRERKTPLSCGNVPGSNRKRQPKRTARERYTSNSCRRAIEYACRKAFPAPDGLDDKEQRRWDAEHRWTPNRVRHLFATRVRREHGLEASQVLLGHVRADVTQVYAERDIARAIQVALAIG